ncbi:hypothetical protein [Methanocorpusculum parvum]
MCRVLGCQPGDIQEYQK